MATKNIVPNADSEGGIGTSSKYWATGFIDAITTTGNLVVGGNVGIGASSPDQALELESSSNLYLHIDRTSGAQVFLGATDAEGLLTTSNSFPLVIKTNNTTTLTLDTSQNATFAGNIKIPNDGTIGSAGTAGALTIASGGDATFAETLTVNGTGISTINGDLFLTNNANLVVQGQNTTHTASSIKISQESSALSEIRCYGADASTQGTFQLLLTASDGSPSATALAFDASANATFANDIILPQDGVVAFNSTSDEYITASADNLFLGVGNLARLHIESDGTLRVKTGNIVVDTAGKGIFLGGTATANNLDHYEEGTWDPVYVGSGGSQNVDNGHYRKVGSLCYLSCSINVNSARTSGENSTISGLPFTAASATNMISAVSFFNVSTTFTGNNIPLGTIASGATTIALYRTSGTNMKFHSVFNAGQTGSLELSVTYMTA